MQDEAQWKTQTRCEIRSAATDQVPNEMNGKFGSEDEEDGAIMESTLLLNTRHRTMPLPIIKC